jgi:hypothetical protein
MLNPNPHVLPSRGRLDGVRTGGARPDPHVDLGGSSRRFAYATILLKRALLSSVKLAPAESRATWSRRSIRSVRGNPNRRAFCVLATCCPASCASTSSSKRGGDRRS